MPVDIVVNVPTHDNRQEYIMNAVRVLITVIMSAMLYMFIKKYGTWYSSMYEENVKRPTYSLKHYIFFNLVNITSDKPI